ncbi:hypothetical protein [Streptomyces sp. ST2-7A]|uniref:hypothetical protein n=1 Tax=Streptomyces sp. ST2-7A TaxID=2907214 RepID=UPI001F4028F9|nr:hypothetical protein [Streptomyces sp. ST2-7A]MCE7081310.1 hypothetical protein [Streptomyces sp. ST2-7A]
MTGAVVPAARPGRGPGRVRTAVLASVADQGVAALTNIAVVVFVARGADAATFAHFAVVYTVFTLLLGAFTAYVGQALVLCRGDTAERARECRTAVAFTPVAAAAFTVPLTVPALVVPGGIPSGLAALGLVLPVVLTQDALRYAFSLLGRPGRALAGDLLRLAVVLPALAMLPSGTGTFGTVLAWGLSALPALALGLFLLRRAIGPARRVPETGPGGTPGADPAGDRGGEPMGDGPARRPLRALLARGHLGRRFVVEFGVGNAGTHLAVIGLGVFASPLAVGALRGATTLFGPMNVLYNAVTGFGPPLLNRLGAPARRARAAAATGGALAVMAVCWGLVLYLLPAEAGRQVLGETWDAAAVLLPATGTQYAIMAAGVCGLVTLRVLRPGATLPIQVTFSALSVVCLVGGYLLGGVLGAAWGLVVGSAAKSLAAWWRVRRVLRDPGPEGEADPGETAAPRDPEGRAGAAPGCGRTPAGVREDARDAGVRPPV